MKPGRVHRDLLSRLSWRWPDPCYLVATRGGNRALIVTEATTSKSLTRLCAFRLDTVNACIRAGWVEVGAVHRVPPYGGGRPGDSQAGQRVWITSAGCVELGVATPAQRRILAAQAKSGVAARGTPQGSVGAEIRASRDGQEAVSG